jgi:hypothetical protein
MLNFNLVVAALTADRYDLTCRTIEALFVHNPWLHDHPLYYADDKSTDDRIRPYMAKAGFKPVILNNSERRIGCSPISDGMLRIIKGIEKEQDNTLVLYLQNDEVCTRPISHDLINDFFAQPNNVCLMLDRRKWLWKRARRRQWASQDIAGEKVVMARWSAWPIQISRLEWLCKMCNNATMERTLMKRGRRQKCITGICGHNPIFIHAAEWKNGKTRKRRQIWKNTIRTPDGIFASIRAWPYHKDNEQIVKYYNDEKEEA